jgi:hypothetical protein
MPPPSSSIVESSRSSPNPHHPGSFELRSAFIFRVPRANSRRVSLLPNPRKTHRRTPWLDPAFHPPLPSLRFKLFKLGTLTEGPSIRDYSLLSSFQKRAPATAVCRPKLKTVTRVFSKQPASIGNARPFAAGPSLSPSSCFRRLCGGKPIFRAWKGQNLKSERRAPNLRTPYSEHLGESRILRAGSRRIFWFLQAE